ncbi:MAG: carbon-nitrogen hydrolase [Prevotella sp.]|nr:carbon-nitrogen hydrolase [Prevotella sp.]MCM1075518.1 carbon-nitrogen hydrolase [Ruminococcus sp.]
MKERTLKTGIIQNHYTADLESNRAKNVESIGRLAESGAELIILSELHDGPYFCQIENVDAFDLAHKIDLSSPQVERYARIAAKYGVIIVTSFFEKRAPGLYHNTSVILERDGSIAGIYRKMHIPDDPAYYEKFYFTPGDLGFKPVKTSVGTLGVCICWDQWYPEAARIMALSGAEILIYPTAIGYESSDSPEEQDRQRNAWITVQRGHAVANGLPVIAVNRVGYEPDPSGVTGGIQFWGNSFVAGPQGELLCELPKDKEELKVIDINISRSEQVRRWWPFLRDRRIDAYSAILKRFND